MDNKTVTIGGVERTFGPIKIGVGRKLRGKYPDPEDYNIAFVAESLKAGGMLEASLEWVDENVNYAEQADYMLGAFGANGIELKVPKPGEDQPAAAG